MAGMSLHMVPVVPVWLALLLVAGLIGVLAHGCVTLLRREVPRRWVIILACLRVGMALLFLLVLLQPVLSWSRTSERRPEMLVMVDVSESMAEPGGSEGKSRLEEVTRTLDDGLAKELASRYELRWFAFDRSATPLEGKEWKGLRAEGAGTHYGDSLTQAISYLPALSPQTLSRPEPQRVLLVSDGLDRGRPGIVEVAKRHHLAVDVLMPGSPPSSDEPAPVTVADVQGSPRVLLGSETHFDVTLRTDKAAKERKVKLVVSEGGKEIDRVVVTIGAGRTEERVRVMQRPGEVGPKRYEFRVEDTRALPMSVQVVDGKHEVLVLEDTWRWEFKFLRRVLEEDPSFRFSAILSRGGGAFMQFAAPDRQSQLVGFPQGHEQLAGFDIVVLGDVVPKRWPRDLAASLRRLVVEDGKSLVVVAGPNLAHWVEVPDLLSLLPVEITRESANPVAGPVPIRVSAEGARSAYFRQPGGVSTLPALDQVYPPLRKKPAATVLLEAAKLGNAAGPLIVIAEHPVGRGRVVYIGTDTLWKWQTLTTAADANTTPYHLFWQQALRALAPTQAGGVVKLRLRPGQGRYEAGQRVTVRARVESAVPLGQASVRGVVNLPDGRALPVIFAADAAEPNAFTAEFEAGAAGAYQVTGTVNAEGRPAATSAVVFDVESARPERDRLPVDAARLADIALATGGKVIDPDDPKTWPERATTMVPVSERVTVDLWGRSWLLVLLVLVAGADWLLRLLRGYV